MSRSAGIGIIAVGAAALTALAPAASTAGASASLVLAPNHSVSAKPPGGGHGGGHGGGGGGGGSVWPGWASSNWSGYAVSGSAGAYHAVTGTWTVPTVQPTKQDSYSAAWIGIDGFTNSSLIQTGTEQDWAGGHARYQAWWTTSDQGFLEQPIATMTIKPGDKMTASITKDKSGESWTLVLDDTDNGQSFKTDLAYAGPGASAEWIVEAPSLGGRIAPLADYGSDVFDPDSINANGSPALTAADGGILIQKNRIVSIPSVPDSEADGFAIAYGSTQPSPPAS